MFQVMINDLFIYGFQLKKIPICLYVIKALSDGSACFEKVKCFPDFWQNRQRDAWDSCVSCCQKSHKPVFVIVLIIVTAAIWKQVDNTAKHFMPEIREMPTGSYTWKPKLSFNFENIWIDRIMQFAKLLFCTLYEYKCSFTTYI